MEPRCPRLRDANALEVSVGSRATSLELRTAFLVHVLVSLSRAEVAPMLDEERTRRSRETGSFSKVDTPTLRLLLPHERFTSLHFSSLVFATVEHSQRSIAWQSLPAISQAHSSQLTPPSPTPPPLLPAVSSLTTAAPELPLHHLEQLIDLRRRSLASVVKCTDAVCLHALHHHPTHRPLGTLFVWLDQVPTLTLTITLTLTLTQPRRP